MLVLLGLLMVFLGMCYLLGPVIGFIVLPFWLWSIRDKRSESERNADMWRQFEANEKRRAELRAHWKEVIRKEQAAKNEVVTN